MFLDLLFPASCIECNTIGSSLCASCQSTIPLHDPACFICNTRNSRGTICTSCKIRVPHLKRVFWVSPYDTPLIHNALIQFKYRGDRTLAEPLSSVIVSSLKKHAQGMITRHAELFSVLPIPLSNQKRRERGFNQAELLARPIAKAFTLPLLSSRVLIRIRHTESQAKTKTRVERVQNMEGAFTVPTEKQSHIAGKTVLLIDDIATTGSTLNNAARALKKAGAYEVWGIVVARG